MTIHRTAVGSSGSLGCGPSTATTDGSASTASLTARQRAGLLGAVDGGDQVDRAGGALAEALDDEVVGLLGGGVVGEVALVGEPEAEAEERDRQHEEERGGAEGEGPRPVLDDPAPSVGGRLAARLRRPVAHLALEGRDEEAQDDREDREQRPRCTASGAIPRPTPTSASATNPAAIRPRHFVRSMLRPANPSSAGSRVIDASTVNRTVSDAVTPRPPTNPMPMKSMPNSEMTTVAPANTTERPAVSIAMPIDSRMSWPACSCSR